MLRSLFLSSSLLFCALLEASFFSALPPLLGHVPVIFVIGVLLYHFLRPNIGAAWLIGGGILLDVLRVPSSVHLFSFTVAALLGIILARKFFANHSLYATVGLGASMYGCALVFEIIWMAIFATHHGRTIPPQALSAFFWQHLLVFVVALLFSYGASRQGATSLRRLFFFRV